jgi:hypothetical protein
MGFQGDLKISGGVEWGANVKEGTMPQPLRRWEVQTWYSTIPLDCRYPQPRPAK